MEPEYQEMLAKYNMILNEKLELQLKYKKLKEDYNVLLKSYLDKK
jgi:hypothetical protein